MSSGFHEALLSRERNLELGLLTLALLAVGWAFALLQLSRAPQLDSGLVRYLLINAALFGGAHISTRIFAPHATPVLLPAGALIQGLGYVMILRLSPDKAAAQFVWTVVAIAVYVVALALLRDYRRIARYQYTFALVGMIALLLPLVPGIGREVNGSTLWVGIGGLTFQPGEIAKIALLFFLAAYLTEKRELLTISTWRIGPVRLPDVKHMIPIFFAWGLSFTVLVAESDLGSSMLLFAVFLAVFWVATGRVAYQVLGILLFCLGAVGAYNFFGHVQTRIGVWLDPFRDYEGAGFQLAQSLFGLGSGGISGAGLGEGYPNFIPLAYSDFIFAAFGEELGLLGATALLVAFLAVVAAGIRTSLETVDAFGKFLAAGLTSILAFQVFIIVGGVTRLIPLTGITLPFFSYGGSSLIANFVILAVLVAISDQRDRPTVDLEELAMELEA